MFCRVRPILNKNDENVVSFAVSDRAKGITEITVTADAVLIGEKEKGKTRLLNHIDNDSLSLFSLSLFLYVNDNFAFFSLRSTLLRLRPFYYNYLIRV